MSVEEGTVFKVKDIKAWVRVKRSEMCEGCRSQKTCHSLSDNMDVESEAVNTAAAKIGDRVLLKIESGSLLKISFVLYMIPVFALVIGALLGHKIGPELGIDSELASLFAAIATCALSFIGVKKIASRMSDKKEYLPEIIKILSKDSNAC